MEFASVDPATGRTVAQWPVADAAAREAALAAGANAFGQWRNRPLGERAALLRAVAVTLRERRVPLAATATTEMGKTRGEALAEVDKCATACEYFAEHGAAMLADVPHSSGDAVAYVSHLPLGVIFAVMPWNFPYWQVIRHAAPSVMAGNAILVKHAENTQGCAVALRDAFLAAGAPEGLVGVVAVTRDDSEYVIADHRIAAVTVTGSPRAGGSVAALAGRELKKTVLELGGSDAFVVLADADVEAAARTAVRSRFGNAGQSCIAAKRFIVERPIADAFIDAFVAGAEQLQVGDPSADGVDMGPMARSDLRDQLAGQRVGTLAGGASELLIGGPRDGDGWFFDPSVLLVTDPDAPAWQEETFGPLAPIFVVGSEQEALDVANASSYGLGGAVWTADLERGRRFARRVETGGMFVNGMTASYPELPFGGVKRSGYGRELARAGILEFTNSQTVRIASPGG